MIEESNEAEGTTFNMGRARLILNAGHGEFGVEENIGRPESVKVTVYVNDPEDYPNRLFKKLTNKVWEAAKQTDAWYDDSDRDWVTVIKVDADVYYLGLVFYRLAMDLDPEMDTFDYWPSGMRLLYQLAVDLDELTQRVPPGNPGAYNRSGNRYRWRYREIVQRAKERGVPELDVPESEEMEDVTTEPYEYEDNDPEPDKAGETVSEAEAYATAREAVIEDEASKVVAEAERATGEEQ
jgi:hypothetical protein